MYVDVNGVFGSECCFGGYLKVVKEEGESYQQV
jgi:hypothetical protein